MTVTDDYHAFVKVKGRISKDPWTSDGGLTVINVLVINQTGRQAFKTYLPINWFGMEGKRVAQDYEKGDVVNIDAVLSMNKARKCRCRQCNQWVQSPHYEVQIIGKKIARSEIDATPPDPVDSLDESDMKGGGDEQDDN